TSVSASGRRYSPDSRSGALSIGDSRTSTKVVAAGTGRASPRRIAALSGPACAHAGAAVASRHRLAASRRRRWDRACRDGGRCLLLFVDMPEIVEVEPVVGGPPGVMFQPGRITPDECRQRFVTAAARQVDAVAEGLEGQLVAVAA